MTKAIAIPDPTDLATWGDRKLDNAIARGATQAGHHEAEARTHLASFEQFAVVTGLLLKEKKSRLKHGEFGPWLAEKFEGDERTAQRYMKAAAEYLNPTPVSASPAPKALPAGPAAEGPAVIPGSVVVSEGSAPAAEEVEEVEGEIVAPEVSEDGKTVTFKVLVQVMHLGGDPADPDYILDAFAGAIGRDNAAKRPLRFDVGSEETKARYEVKLIDA